MHLLLQPPTMRRTVSTPLFERMNNHASREEYRHPDAGASSGLLATMGTYVGIKAGSGPVPGLEAVENICVDTNEGNESTRRMSAGLVNFVPLHGNEMQYHHAFHQDHSEITISIPEGDTSSVNSAVSEVTLMTFKAEIMREQMVQMLMKRYLCEEDPERKEQIARVLVDQEDRLQLTHSHRSFPRDSFSLNVDRLAEVGSNAGHKHDDSIRTQEENRHLLYYDKLQDDNGHCHGQGGYENGTLSVNFGLLPIPESKNDSGERVHQLKGDGSGFCKKNPGIEQRQSRGDTGLNEDSFIDSVIELKLQLAQQQSVIDELSSKYNQQMLTNEHLKEKLELSLEAQNIEKSKAASLSQENAELRETIEELQSFLTGKIDNDHIGQNESKSQQRDPLLDGEKIVGHMPFKGFPKSVSHNDLTAIFARGSDVSKMKREHRGSIMNTRKSFASSITSALTSTFAAVSGTSEMCTLDQEGQTKLDVIKTFSVDTCHVSNSISTNRRSASLRSMFSRRSNEAPSENKAPRRNTITCIDNSSKWNSELLVGWDETSVNWSDAGSSMDDCFGEDSNSVSY